jgi:hypothetical protein
MLVNIIVILTMIGGILHGLSKLSSSGSTSPVYNNLFDFLFDIRSK